MPLKPLTKIKKDKKLTDVNTFMTFDIETTRIGNTVYPYLICGCTSDNYIVSNIS